MNKNTIITAVFLSVLPIMLCSLTGDVKAGTAIDNSKTAIGMMTQEYIGDNIAEIPMIFYDGLQPSLKDYNHKNPEIELINGEIKNGIQQTYNNFNKKGKDWIEIKTYPFTSKRYIQFIITSTVFPNYGTDGSVCSYNFDKSKNKWISIEEILKDMKLTKGELAKKVSNMYASENKTSSITKAVAKGFLLSGKSAEILLEVNIKHKNSEPEQRICKYSPSNQHLIFYNGICLYDKSKTDKMKPPLFCQKYSRNQ